MDKLGLLKLANYWFCITNKDNWKVIRERKIWGVSGRNRKQLESVKPGDKLIFYVKPKRIAGVFESVSDMFESDARIFSSVGFTGEEIFPFRIKLKALIIPKESIEFTPLIPKMTFVKRKDTMWRGSIYGKAMRQIPENDYKVIEDKLKR